MAARTYDNFDILIEAIDEGAFRARVTNCTAGDTPAMSFALPFSPLQLENLLLKLNPARAGTRRMLDPHAQASVDLGAGLFESVFREDILLAWIRSSDTAREHQHGLRLRLRLADAPSLAGLPWEFLYDRKSRRFFAQSDRTPVVRYLDVANPPQPLAVRGPLRILVVISSPQDLPPLDVEHEWSQIHEVLAEKERMGLVIVNRLPYPSLSELQKWLRRHEVHVLHFVGHGDFDGRTGDGLLAFCDRLGRLSPVTSVQLGAHVRDHDPLRLVVLNACRTATTDNMDAFSGMAQGLIQQEAAAVVAMQFPISDGAAIAFTTEFYGAIADGEPVDQALASARKALLTDFGEEWATPVLYLRAADGQIFEQVTQGTSASAMPEAPVPEQIEKTAVIRRPPITADSTPVRSTAVAAERSTPPEAARPQTPPEAARPQTPPEAARPQTPPLPIQPRPARRRRAILIVATAIAVAIGVTFAIVQHRRTAMAGPSGGPSSGHKTSAQLQPSRGQPAGSRPPGSYSLVGTQVVWAYNGPSSEAYSRSTTLSASSVVQLTCALYGQRLWFKNGSDSLWYWTDHGWINDHFILTGTSKAIRNECTTAVGSPMVGDKRPTASTGPFATIGKQEIEVKATPYATVATVDTLQTDRLVTIICHRSGDYVEAGHASGGISGTDWDEIGEGRWIPNAYLLTGTSSSPASPCPVSTATPTS
jgi:CHAT domain